MVKQIKNLTDFEKVKKDIIKQKKSNKPCIIISEKSTCCYLSGSKEVVEAFEEELKNFKLKSKIDIKTTGCLGTVSDSTSDKFENRNPKQIQNPNDQMLKTRTKCRLSRRPIQLWVFVI